MGMLATSFFHMHGGAHDIHIDRVLFFEIFTFGDKRWNAGIIYI